MNRWMQNLPMNIKEREINKIILPGTHDSGAYKVMFDVELGSSIELGNTVDKLKNMECVKNIIKSWTITQYNDIYNQLNNGIRLFDFRVAYNENDKSYYISHTFACVKLETILSDIAKFMNECGEEVLVLLFKPDWNNREKMTTERNDEVIRIINNKLGDYLCFRTADNKFMKYNEMVNDDERVIIYYETKNSKNYNFLWPRSYLNNPWDNTHNMNIKKEMMEKNMNNMKSSNRRINFISFTLTPDKKLIVDDIIKYIISFGCYQTKGVEELAKTVQEYFNKFIKEYEEEIENLSGIYTDFPNDNIINSIIKLNNVIHYQEI